MSYDSSVDTYEHIRAVKANLLQVELNLSMRGASHDYSKLEEPEKSAFDAIGPDKPPYNTPEYERMKGLLGPALEHHYAVNDHHPEHYEHGLFSMSLLSMTEMLADWKAASDREGRTLAESLHINAKRFGYSACYDALLRNTARELGWI